MTERAAASIASVAEAQQIYFKSHATKSVNLRLGNLKKFKSAILRYETKQPKKSC